MIHMAPDRVALTCPWATTPGAVARPTGQPTAGGRVLRVEVPAVLKELSMMCVNIPIDRIIVPPKRREIENLEPYIRSMRDLGLLAPIMVKPQGEEYLLVLGHGRLQAAKALGCTHIAAVIRTFDRLHAELATINENLIRQELPALERAEQLRRRKEIYEQLHSEAGGQAGPGRGHHEKRRNDFAPFAAAMGRHWEEWEIPREAEDPWDTPNTDTILPAKGRTSEGRGREHHQAG